MDKLDYSLYLITDREMLKGRDLIEEVVRAVKGGVTMVQLREKEISSRDFYHIASQLKNALEPLGVPLIINDRLDIAMAINADGVHIGQKDLPLNVVRSLLGNQKIIGLSVSNLQQARQGERDGASYLGIGSVFYTDSKKDIDEPIGTNMLALFRRYISLPLVAIGGINVDNLPLIKQAGIDGVAVISAILKEENVEEAARRMISTWKNR